MTIPAELIRDILSVYSLMNHMHVFSQNFCKMDPLLSEYSISSMIHKVYKVRDYFGDNVKILKGRTSRFGNVKFIKNELLLEYRVYANLHNFMFSIFSRMFLRRVCTICYMYDSDNVTMQTSPL